MIIKKFPSGPFVTNAYVLVCEETAKAAIIDPAPGSATAINSFLERAQVKVDKILLTHSHWDHIVDTHALKAEHQAPVYIHSLDKGNLEAPGTDGLPLFGACEGVKADYFLSEGEKIFLGKLEIQVIHTPGHTPGGVCFYLPKENTLFSGDTLFQGSIGNLSFPTAQPELMWESLAKLEKLPQETQVLPGHGDNTTIETEYWLPNAKQIFGG